MTAKPRLLLHACCATCSGFLARELSRDFSVTIFFDNPNIYPEAEYQKRRDEARDFFRQEGFDFLETEYRHGQWREFIHGLENEPERGKRCKLCYFFRLQNTAEFAQKSGYEYFASTLAISPYKDAKIINNLGAALAKKQGLKFLAGDWKKQDGFRRAMACSHEHNFYRQNYCGCDFSRVY